MWAWHAVLRGHLDRYPAGVRVKVLGRGQDRCKGTPAYGCHVTVDPHMGRSSHVSGQVKSCIFKCREQTVFKNFGLIFEKHCAGQIKSEAAGLQTLI